MTWLAATDTLTHIGLELMTIKHFLKTGYILITKFIVESTSHECSVNDEFRLLPIALAITYKIPLKLYF